MLGRARNGSGGALLLVGEAGIGKTALLNATLVETSGVQVLRANGFEAESTIPFAALQRLMMPLRGHFSTLPGCQQSALRVAAGVADGPPPDGFLLGLGVLGLLAAAAQVQPVVCAVDDAHLLDSESLAVLGFVARRVEAESAALVFAGSEALSVQAETAGIPSLRLNGLDPDAAIQLLLSSVHCPIDLPAAEAIVAATGGNPLALIDLAGDLTARRLTESSFSDEPIMVGRRLEAFYSRRLGHLASDVQLWLLIAAADSTGNLDLIGAAAHALGVPGNPVDEAEAAELVEAGSTVRFRHPLVRSAVYNSAQGPQRRRVHRALSTAALGLGLLELEAWHAAKATLGTDTAVAARLERVADLAGRRGGLSSRATWLVQSSALTPHGAQKYSRLVAAAEAALASGSAQLAKTLLDDIDEEILDPISRGRLITARASLAIFLADPALTMAGAHMVAAAESFHGHDAALEQNALIRAFEFILPAEREARGMTLVELGNRMREAADLQDGVAATLLRALSAHILLPYAEAVPVMRAAVDAIGTMSAGELLEYGAVGVALTTALWDAAACRDCLDRTVAAAREAGSLQLLNTTWWLLSLAELTGGTPARARQYVEQVGELRRAIGFEAEHVINAAFLAWSGAPRPQVEMIAEGAGALGFGGVRASADRALAVRDLAEGRYDDAYARLKPLVDDPFLQVTPHELPDFIEAACRSGHAEEANVHVDRLEELAAANGSAWNLGAAQRSRALLAPDPEHHFRAGVATLEATGVEMELARTHLLYGEWLRRGRRRREAREHLRRAVELFDVGSAPSFTQRARNELDAIGDHAPAGRSLGSHELTAQEKNVARLAASGSTNAEIGMTMFLSANTVDYHLRKVFQKLGISSRRQLADHLAQANVPVP
jgi:DNA-binding CsgD family transcriptional regulator